MGYGKYGGGGGQMYLMFLLSFHAFHFFSGRWKKKISRVLSNGRFVFLKKKRAFFLHWPCMAKSGIFFSFFLFFP